MGQITSEFMLQVQRTSFDGFSEKTLHETKKAVIDTIGCMLAGTRSPIGKATMEVFEGFGGQPESSVIGSTRKVPAAIAAYINAETCVGPDLSDNYQPESVILSHPDVYKRQLRVQYSRPFPVSFLDKGFFLR